MTTRSTRTRRDGIFWNATTKWWHLDYRDATGQRRRLKASPDAATARLMYANLVVRLAKEEITGRRDEGLLFRTFVDERYWPAVAPTLAPSWAERTRKWILDTTLLPRFGGLALRALKPEAIARWYAERRSEVSPSTANKDLTRLKHALGHAVEWGYLTVNPAAKIRKAKEPPGRVVLLEPEVRQRPARGRGAHRRRPATAGQWSWPVRPSRTLRLYIEAVMLSAARRSELTRLVWADVDLGRRQVSFRHTKSGHARVIPMSRDLEALLRRLPRGIDRRAPVLPVIDPKVLTRELCAVGRADRPSRDHAARLATRRRVPDDPGGREPTGGDGGARPPGSADDDPLSAPRPGAPRRGRPGAHAACFRLRAMARIWHTGTGT